MFGGFSRHYRYVIKLKSDEARAELLGAKHKHRLLAVLFLLLILIF